MRSVTRLATLLFATAALTACEDKADFSNILVPVVPVTSIGGTFGLQTLNGLGLPQTITIPTIGTVTVDSSSLTLVTTNSTSGTFTLVIHVPAPDPAITVTGDYTLSGTNLTLVPTTPAGLPNITGTWDGSNMLTLSEFGATAVFTRP